LIELEGVSKVYRVGDQDVHALADVTERVEAGELVALVGPSGSGKSTLLNVVGCLDRPTSGTYRFDGDDVSALDEAALTDIRRNRIGFVFQSYHLIERFDARGNVELPMIFAGVAPRERRDRARAALEAVGLGPRARHRPSQLSGGERQRVAIARATVLSPRLLLADEPTGNLDSAAGAQVMALLEEMNAKGLTLIVVTHDPGVARRARRVLVLRDGRIAERTTGAGFTGALRG